MTANGAIRNNKRQKQTGKTEHEHGDISLSDINRTSWSLQNLSNLHRLSFELTTISGKLFHGVLTVEKQNKAGHCHMFK